MCVRCDLKTRLCIGRGRRTYVCVCAGLVVDRAEGGGFAALILGDILSVLGCYVCNVGEVNVIYHAKACFFSLVRQNF